MVQRLTSDLTSQDQNACKLVNKDKVANEDEPELFVTNPGYSSWDVEKGSGYHETE